MRRTTQSTVYDTQQYVTQHTIQHTYMYETHHSQSHTANTAEHIIRCMSLAFVTHHSMLDSETDNIVQKRQNALFSILPITALSWSLEGGFDHLSDPLDKVVPKHSQEKLTKTLIACL